MELIFEPGEGEKKLNFHKKMCKKLKKFNNPNKMTLMQIQHKYAKELGYKNWKELLDKERL